MDVPEFQFVRCAAHIHLFQELDADGLVNKRDGAFRACALLGRVLVRMLKLIPSDSCATLLLKVFGVPRLIS